VKSPEAKERLKPLLDKGNVDQTMAAPVTAIFGYDLAFYEKMPKLFPHTDARAWFVGKEEKIKVTAIRSANLQAAYYMLAARSLGLDCGPMSGFNAEGATTEFFAGKFGGAVKANFLCNMGYGTPDGLYPRGPRLDFDEAIEIV
jgi:3-hydroxypropanoate dehydrogenase